MSKKENYDRIELLAPKGYKADIKAHAESCQQSVNSFIMTAIAEKIERDNGGKGITSEIVSPAALAMAERAAHTTGETVRAFIARAIDTQEDLDLTTIDHGYNPVSGKKAG